MWTCCHTILILITICWQSTQTTTWFVGLEDTEQANPNSNNHTMTKCLNKTYVSVIGRLYTGQYTKVVVYINHTMTKLPDKNYVGAIDFNSYNWSTKGALACISYCVPIWKLNLQWNVEFARTAHSSLTLDTSQDCQSQKWQEGGWHDTLRCISEVSAQKMAPTEGEQPELTTTNAGTRGSLVYGGQPQLMYSKGATSTLGRNVQILVVANHGFSYNLVYLRVGP